MPMGQQHHELDNLQQITINSISIGVLLFQYFIAAGLLFSNTLSYTIVRYSKIPHSKREPSGGGGRDAHITCRLFGNPSTR